MTARTEPGRQLTGRPEELRRLAALVAGAAEGRAGAVVVLGDAGVGKTSLVRCACADAPPHALHLAASCLPLSALSAPLLPLRTAFRDLPEAASPLRHLLDPGAVDPLELDAWLAEECAVHPVVLSVDDVQWADQSTLDLLQFLLAGPRNRPLAVLVTVRSTELRDGHPLHRWLADVRRLPGTDELRLAPLARAATARQLEDLLGAAPHASLVEEVFDRSAGNPYLTRLLVSGLTADVRHLGDDLPVDLESAVLRVWHGLPEPARRLASLLAVAGRRTDVDLLLDVAHAAGVEADEAAATDGLAAGLLAADDGGLWFHHPLQAEALQRRLMPGIRRAWHAAFARVLEVLDEPPAGTALALAEHHDRAGAPAQAYRWALQAWAGAGSARTAPEILGLLRRAVDLRPLVPEAAETRDHLLDELREAARAAGAEELELEALEELLATLDPVEQPLRVAEHLVRRSMLRLSTGRAFADPTDVRAALALSSCRPDSWQHALARAELAHLSMWAGDHATAVEESAEALRVARAAGDPRALTFALTARSIAVLDDGEPDAARELAEAAGRAAVEARDWWAYLHAAAWRLNATEVWSSRRCADGWAEHREELARLGAPSTYLARLSAYEADARLASGDWHRCTELLRLPLGSDPGPMADAYARLTAALLAAHQGRLSEADGHLARADELFAVQTTFLAASFDAVRTSVQLAHGRWEAAWSAALAGATSEGVPPTRCQWLLPLAARSLAELAQRGRDLGEELGLVLARVEALVERFPRVLEDGEIFTDLGRRQVEAMQAWYEAEVARARGYDRGTEHWVAAAAAFERAELPAEAAYVCFRAAEASLAGGRGGRARGAGLLRQAQELAERLEARPLLGDVAALARTSRVSLVRPGADGAPVRLPGPSLTAREREILEHVVVGRTYAEIAAALVISEKTVSSHVSNLLRKTGTASRVELSLLAARAAR